MARPLGIRDVRDVAFQPAHKAALGFEVFKLSELRARFAHERPARTLEGALRLEFHVIYVGLGGRGSVVVDFARAPLGAGWLTVVARGRVHHYTADSRRADAWMLLLSPEFLTTSVRDPFGAPALLSARAAPAIAIDRPLRAELHALCELLAAEYARPLDAVQPALLASLVRGVLLYGERAARGATDTALPPELARFFAAVERDAGGTRSVAHYARVAAVSPRRLGDLLTAHTGRTTKQVIDERVTLEAKRLLAHTELSIKQLADRLGFSEPTNFVKFFRLHARVTPQAFRARFDHPATGSDLGRSRRSR